MSQLLAAADANGGTVTQVLAGIAAIIAAFGAIKLNKRDNDAEELRTTKRQMSDLQSDLLTLRKYIFTVQGEAASQGLVLPEPPHLRSEDW